MTLTFIVLLVFVILSVNGQTTLAPEENCGPHATWTNCSRRCPMTCSMLNERPHHYCPPDVCLQGCMCDRGYVRQSRTNLCVRPKDCDRNVNP